MSVLPLGANNMFNYMASFVGSSRWLSTRDEEKGKNVF